MIYTKNYVQISIRIRFPSEELNLWLYATDINGLSYLDNCSVLNIHILFMIGAIQVKQSCAAIRFSHSDLEMKPILSDFISSRII